MKKLIFLSIFSLMTLAKVSAVTYYNRMTSPRNCNVLTDWTTNSSGGAGTSPADFTTSGDIFQIRPGSTMGSSNQWVMGAGVKANILGTLNASVFDHVITIDMSSTGRYRTNGLYNNLVFGTLSTASIFVVLNDFITDASLRTDLIYPGLTISPPVFVSILGDLPGNITTTGSLTITLNETDELNFGGDQGDDITVNVGGNFSLTKGTVRINNSTFLTTLNVTGNFTVTGGTLIGTANDGGANITCSNFTSGGTVNLVDGGSIGFPTLTLTGDLNIAGGSYNAQANDAISIPIFNLNGTSRNISGASLANANHTINLNGSYTLASNFTVGGNLNLNNAYTLNLGTFKATLGGELNIVGSGGNFSGSSGTLEFASSTADVSLPAVSLNGLIINCPSRTVTMIGSVSVGLGGVVLTNGTLSISNRTLTINGDISGTATLLGGASSNVVIGAPGAGSITGFPSVSLNNFSIDRTGGVTLAGAVTVAGTLTLTSGTLDNTSNTLTLATGASIVRNNAGTDGFISAPPTFGTTVNVTYSGTIAITSGNELPATSTVLNNLTMNNSNTVTISSARTVNGALTLTQGTLASGSGNLTMNLNSGYIDKDGTGTISGNIVCTKTITRSGYTYIGTPVTGTINFPATSFFDTYVETSHNRDGDNDAGWVSTSTSQLVTVGADNVMRGYAAYYGSGTTAISVNGAYAHNTDRSINVTRTVVDGPADDGWNLVANPFPSTFDWEAQSASFPSNIAKQIQYWNGSAYEAYTAGVPAGDELGKIAPFQAFFMQVTSGSSATLTFASANRVGSTKSLKREQNKVANVLQITATSGNLMDKSYIRLHDGSTAKFDNDYDASKLDNDPAMPMLWTESEGVRYSINALPSSVLESKDSIPLNFKIPQTANYTFNFSEDARIDDKIQIYLIDKLLGVKQDVRLNPIYNATLVKDNSEARFFISFNGMITGTESEQAFSASTNNGNVNAYFKNVNGNSAKIDLLNSLGQSVYTIQNADISSGKFTFTPNITEQTGVYILKASVGNKVYTNKILFNN